MPELSFARQPEQARAELQAGFGDAMAELASGVAVITARAEGGAPCGLLVTSLCSYSRRPPSILVSIDRARRSHDPLVACEHFGTHLLGRDQASLARLFAAPVEDRFRELPWQWDTDVPVLPDVIAYLRCRREAVFAHGDHSILLGEVTEIRVAPREPLCYLRRRMDWRVQEDPISAAVDAAGR
jgi:flavin reductase ActVB